jgi:aldehyde:ferredoxin oxidoreductase
MQASGFTGPRSRGEEKNYMKGFFNTILRIDLTEQTFTYDSLSDEVLRQTLGGKGLGIHFMLRENPEGVDPLSPENRFIIAVGPITGTKVWSQSRFAAFSKSPATGGFFESYCGGSLAPKIKGCGVDAIIMHGACPKLSFLTVDESGVEFHDAGEIEGKETFLSEEYILEHSPEGAGAMVIGPAGENLAACACIKSDNWRSLGRGGMGAVLGAKNVKGMSFSGTRKAEVADEEVLKKVIKGVAKKGKEMPVTKFYQTYGTAGQVKVTNGVGCFPTRYWQSGRFDKFETLTGDYMVEHFDVSRHGCPTCFLQCTKKNVIKEGRHAGLVVEGPEYETIYSIGGLNCIEGLEEVAYLNDVCDRLGIDTMTAGNLSAFAVEAYKRGKTDFPIDYNEPDRVADIYRAIAYREGVGDILAKGIKQAAKELGMEDVAVHSKGLEPAGFDPRVLKGMGLSYATAARGACHLRGTFYKAELSGEMDPEQIEGKAELQIDYEDRSAIFDTLILCRFFRDFILWDELIDLVKGSTGLSFTKEELELFANRLTQDTRRYNLREGVGSSEDTLPPWILKHANDEGASLTDSQLETMIKEYNKIREERYEKTETKV